MLFSLSFSFFVFFFVVVVVVSFSVATSQPTHLLPLFFIFIHIPSAFFVYFPLVIEIILNNIVLLFEKGRQEES